MKEIGNEDLKTKKDFVFGGLSNKTLVNKSKKSRDWG